MCTIVLCGGRGTRAYPHTLEIPKPLLDVAGRPVLDHVLHIYGAQGVRRFVLAAGYKIDLIRDYARTTSPDWEVQVVDTGVDSGTATRIWQCRDFVDDRFFVTYSDGVADIQLTALLGFHADAEATATITTVPLPSQYGTVTTNREGQVLEFEEKPRLFDHWVNAGFFVMENSVFTDWTGEDLERETLPALAAAGRLYAYRHHGFWKSMDTYKDAVELSELARTGSAPWL